MKTVSLKDKFAAKKAMEYLTAKNEMPACADKTIEKMSIKELFKIKGQVR